MKSPADYAPKVDHLNRECPVRAAIDVVRGRWKPSILCELKLRPRRFTELRDALPGVTAQALTVQLRQLEVDGVIARTVFAEIPARVEYHLTEYGMSLSEVMDALESWGSSYLARKSAGRA